ncbi:MAG TPA: nucleotide exchange factor GrpE [Candidatus Paceibacterota bacterium]|nr:nucleotide exchange factor GrpE [Candidatus Paceibacterota bacterium]HMO83084.1 nucleotide exchange factor GrpE [Candidatus Paceibacterota bacterium]
MVKKSNNENPQDDVEITNDENIEIHEPELGELEEKQGTFNNTLRDKLKACEAEKKNLLDEMGRTKADFLNARRRLEEDRKRDRERITIEHIESLIPLCDSFSVAMSNKEVWEKADENWRRGIEGINAQLNNILAQHQVVTLKPLGEAFDPREHEALSIAPTTDKDQHDRIIAVVQNGFALKRSDGNTELIRPARVVIGVYEQN